MSGPAPISSAIPYSARTAPSTTSPTPTADNTAAGAVPGGVAALPVADVTFSSVVPNGWTRHHIGRVRFAAPSSWSNAGSSDLDAWDAWFVQNKAVAADQTNVGLLIPPQGSKDGDAQLAAFAISGAGWKVQDGWTIPDQTASWRLDVPGTGLCAMDVTTASIFVTEVEVDLQADDGVYYVLYLDAPRGDSSDAQVTQFLESLSVS